MPVIFSTVFREEKSPGVSSPFLVHCRNISTAFSLEIWKGSTLLGLCCPVSRSSSKPGEPQKLHTVAEVCSSVSISAPQEAQRYTLKAPSSSTAWGSNASYSSWLRDCSISSTGRSLPQYSQDSVPFSPSKAIGAPQEGHL